MPSGPASFGNSSASAASPPLRLAARARMILKEDTMTSVMIDKFAGASCKVWSEFIDLNHTSKSMILVSLMIPKFAPEPSLEYRRTSESGH